MLVKLDHLRKVKNNNEWLFTWTSDSIQPMRKWMGLPKTIAPFTSGSSLFETLESKGGFNQWSRHAKHRDDSLWNSSRLVMPPIPPIDVGTGHTLTITSRCKMWLANVPHVSRWQNVYKDSGIPAATHWRVCPSWSTNTWWINTEPISLSGWWFQPTQLKIMLVKMGIFPKEGWK